MSNVMTIQGIKTNVQALLEDSDYFVDVTAAPQDGTVKFTGYPSVSHYYNNTENDFATVSQNRRVITYDVMMYLVTPEGTNIETEFSQAYTLLDNVVALFDATKDLSDSSLGLSPACDIMRPATGSIMRVDTSEGTGLELNVRLYCETDVAF